MNQRESLINQISLIKAITFAGFFPAQGKKKNPHLPPKDARQRVITETCTWHTDRR